LTNRALARVEIPERVLHHEVEQTHAVGMRRGLARDDAREVTAEVEVGHAAEPALAHLLADLEQREQAAVVEVADDALPVLELAQGARLEGAQLALAVRDQRVRELLRAVERDEQATREHRIDEAE